MIEYRPCEKTRNEITMAKLRGMAAVRLTPIQKIEWHARAIAAEMRKLHGGEFKVAIDHHCTFAFVNRDR